MNFSQIKPESPAEIEAYFDRLWPLLRSITGDGVRQTIEILSEIIPLEIMEVPTGTKVFDWTVPKEWVVRDAYVLAPDGRRILDVNDNNLHLLNYSVGFRGTVSREELDKHLYSDPALPDAIPYVTSYYEPRWGFCISQNDRAELESGDYQVIIDCDHIDGSLTIAEAVLPGEDDAEVLFHTYTCHPSMANNELSGPLATAFLYLRLAQLPKRRLTYRFVFAPETIGAISYLSLRGEHLRKTLVAGYIVTCVGDDGAFTFKRSRLKNTLADRVTLYTLENSGAAHTVREFDPSNGSDERQYCSPGINLPVSSISRTIYGEYPEYHSSLDNRDYISFDALKESIDMLCRIIENLEKNARYQNLSPNGEPQLGRRGLYASLGEKQVLDPVAALLWLLNYSDGENDLLNICEKSGFDLDTLFAAAERAESTDILNRLPQIFDKVITGADQTTK
jgi:aminopeptidase-like protein